MGEWVGGRGGRGGGMGGCLSELCTAKLCASMIHSRNGEMNAQIRA